MARPPLSTRPRAASAVSVQPSTLAPMAPVAKRARSNGTVVFVATWPSAPPNAMAHASATAWSRLARSGPDGPLQPDGAPAARIVGLEKPALHVTAGASARGRIEAARTSSVHARDGRALRGPEPHRRCLPGSPARRAPRGCARAPRRRPPPPASRDATRRGRARISARARSCPMRASAMRACHAQLRAIAGAPRDERPHDAPGPPDAALEVRDRLAHRELARELDARLLVLELGRLARLGHDVEDDLAPALLPEAREVERGHDRGVVAVLLDELLGAREEARDRGAARRRSGTPRPGASRCSGWPSSGVVERARERRRRPPPGRPSPRGRRR